MAEWYQQQQPATTAAPGSDPSTNQGPVSEQPEENGTASTSLGNG